MQNKIKLKYKNFDFINFALPIVDFICAAQNITTLWLCFGGIFVFLNFIQEHKDPIGNSPNQKYDNEYFLICLVDFVETSFNWLFGLRLHGNPNLKQNPKGVDTKELLSIQLMENILIKYIINT